MITIHHIRIQTADLILTWHTLFEPSPADVLRLLEKDETAELILPDLARAASTAQISSTTLWTREDITP